MSLIDLNSLPREIKDKLEMKSETDPTFFRCLEENYSDELFETLETRRSVDSNHSFIASCFGPQGCHAGYVKIWTNKGLKQMKDISINDKVYSFNFLKNKVEIKKVLKIWKYKSDVYSWKTKRGCEVDCTLNHNFFIPGFKETKTNISNISQLVSITKIFNGKIHKNRSFWEGFLAGLYLADGYIKHKIFYIAKQWDMHELMEHYAGLKITYRINKKKYYIISGNKQLIEQYGHKLSNKILPDNIYMKPEYAFGILNGFANGDMSIDNQLTRVNKKLSCRIHFSFGYKHLAESFYYLLLFFGFQGKLFKKRESLWMIHLSNTVAQDFLKKIKIYEPLSKKTVGISDKDYNFWMPVSEEYQAYHNYIRRNYYKNSRNFHAKRTKKIYRSMLYKDWNDCSHQFWKKTMNFFKYRNSDEIISQSIMKGVEDVYDITVENNHNYILSNGLLSSNSGKSYLSLSLSGFLDPRFNIDKIYFDYSKLVYDRRSLKPHSAILVDEQAEAYGIDSMRVSIILKALKEQLRKKSIHFFFCSPTLKPEYESSQYVFETMFLDHKTKTCFAAYKTRELLTLGYVQVPHPLQFISKELLAAYEEKKDIHLDQLTGKIQIDEIEEAAKRITQHPLFISAEKLYKSVRGYIPTQMLIQLINKIYPEFKANVMAMEIASRVKLNKEMTGDWSIVGQKKGGERNG